MDLHKLAFEELFLNHYEKLVQFAFLFLKNIQLAEDAVADVFASIWKKPERLSGVSNIEAYLYTSVKNACFDQLKRMERGSEGIYSVPEKLSSSNSEIEGQEL